MTTAKVPTTVAPKYIHNIQQTVTSSDDLTFTVGPTERLKVVESIAFNQSVTLQGDLIVEDSAYHPDVVKYAGVVKQPSFKDNGNGTFTIGDDGKYNLYSSLTENTPLVTYSLPGFTRPIAEGELGYVCVCYNSGSPLLTYTTNRADVQSGSQMTRCIVATVLRYEGSITELDWDSIGIGLSEKRLERAFDVEGRFTRSLAEPGLIIEDLGSLNFKTTSGVIWTPVKKISLSEVIANVDRIELHYKDGSGVWTYDLISSLDNLHYMTPTGLVELTANRYAVNWVWIKVDDSKTLAILLGEGDYKLIDAQSSYRPVPPPEITSLGFFVGRVIVQKSATTITQIDNSLTTDFSQAAALVHNDLSDRAATACHPATAVSFTPYDTVTSVDVQAAMQELRDDTKSLEQIGLDTHFVTGFLDRTSSTISIATRTITIAPTGTSFSYYLDGVKITKTGGTTCQTTIPATVGLHYIYFDAAGQLQNSMTPWAFENSLVFVAQAYWNGSAASRHEERHHAGRDIRNHEALHFTRGTAYRSGLAQTYPSTASDQITQIESGLIYDEDIKLTIAQLKIVRHWYQTTSGVWIWANGVNNGGYDRPCLWNAGTSRVQYPKSNAAYALTDAGSAQYVCVWVYANNDMDRPIMLVTKANTAAYTTIALARAETQPDGVSTITPETKLIYRWIFRGDGEFQESADYRTVSALPGGTAASVVHNNTTGIQGGAAGEYYHLSYAEYVALASPHALIMSRLSLGF